MSLTRRLLLRASRSVWLARTLRQRAFFSRAVRRFLPGEDLSDALAAAAGLAQAGLGSVLTHLGEQVTSRDEAAAVREQYSRVFDEIRLRRLPAEISVKLTHLGLELNPKTCLEHLLALAARAADARSFLWIDMEESRYVDATLELYQAVRAAHSEVGVCLQAYLRRTPTDLEALAPLTPAIRLVKGAYNESPAAAFPRKRDVDAAYGVLGGRLLELAARGGARAVFGTHDLDLVARLRDRALALGLTGGDGAGGYEVHMLYGIRAAAQRTLAQQGVAVRVLISYGAHWFPWYMRRLAERPANVWFVLRHLLG
jgi:proline dehydrogenase